MYKTKLDHVAAMAELAKRMEAAVNQALKESACAITDEIMEELKGEKE